MDRDLTLDRVFCGLSIDIGSVDCTVYILYILSTLKTVRNTISQYHINIIYEFYIDIILKTVRNTISQYHINIIYEFYIDIILKSYFNTIL